jgi:hypothetical protein
MFAQKWRMILIYELNSRDVPVPASRDNPAFFYILYPAGYRILKNPDIRLIGRFIFNNSKVSPKNYLKMFILLRQQNASV